MQWVYCTRETKLGTEHGFRQLIHGYTDELEEFLIVLKYTSSSIIQTSIICTLDYPNSSKATFYYYNLQDSRSLVALWQL